MNLIRIRDEYYRLVTNSQHSINSHWCSNQLSSQGQTSCSWRTSVSNCRLHALHCFRQFAAAGGKSFHQTSNLVQLLFYLSNCRTTAACCRLSHANIFNSPQTITKLSQQSLPTEESIHHLQNYPSYQLSVRKCGLHNHVRSFVHGAERG